MRPLFAFTLCWMACGCPSSPSGTDASVDPVDAAAPPDALTLDDAGSDAGPTECNALTNLGTVVQQMYVATAGETGSGGTITSGTYILTAASVYTGAGGSTGPTGATLADTLVLADGATYERVFTAMNAPGPDGTFHQSGTYTTDGASIQATQTCPPGTQPFTSYDSDGTVFRIYAPATGPLDQGLMFEYTRQ